MDEQRYVSSLLASHAMLMRTAICSSGYLRVICLVQYSPGYGNVREVKRSQRVKIRVHARRRLYIQHGHMPQLMAYYSLSSFIKEISLRAMSKIALPETRRPGEQRAHGAY